MFNFTDVSTGDFAPLEPGIYKAFVEECKFKTTKAGTGEYLNVQFKLPDLNRVVFGMYNLLNPNPKAVEIAMKDVTAMLIAMGYKQEDLSGIEKHMLLEMIDQKDVMLKLKIERDDTYGDKNKIVGYSPVKAPISKPMDDLPL